MTVHKKKNKTQSAEQILADKHKGKKCLTAITWSSQDNGKFQRPWSAAMGEGRQSKTWRRADPAAASRLYERDDGGFTTPERLFTFREWRYWIIIWSSEKDITRVWGATNQIYWSKYTGAVFSLSIHASPSLWFLQMTSFPFQQNSPGFPNTIKILRSLAKKAKYFILRRPLTKQIRFRPDIREGDTAKLHAKNLTNKRSS